jgi:uncharacterized membrane protein YbhN (UPF0104 family)
MSDQIKKILKLLLKLGLSIVAIVLIVNKIDFDKVVEYFATADVVFLVLAVLSFFISKLVGSFRINNLYKTQDLQLSSIVNYKLYLAGMFYNLFIPLIGGEGFKVVWLKKKFEIKMKKLVWASLLDKVSGIMGLTLLVLILINFISFEFEYKWVSIPLIFLAYGAHYLGVFLFFKSFLPSWFITSIQSVIVQFFQLMCAFLILKSLNVGLEIIDYLFIFLVSCYAYALPMLGARELAFVLGAEYMGLNIDLTLAIGIIFYLSLALNSIAGAYFMFQPIDKEEA